MCVRVCVCVRACVWIHVRAVCLFVGLVDKNAEGTYFEYSRTKALILLTEKISQAALSSYHALLCAGCAANAANTPSPAPGAQVGR